MLRELWEQGHPEPLDRAAGLVAGFVLIEAQVRVSSGLTNIQAERVRPGPVLKQDHVNRVVRPACSERRRVKGMGCPRGLLDPIGPTTHELAADG